MKMVRRFLVLIILTELLGGSVLVYNRLQRAVPPEADWSLLDRLTADDLRAAVATCQTPNDWRRLGELYMAAGCFAESEMCHRGACEMAPTNAVFRRQWGFALERLGLLNDADGQYQKAMELSEAELHAGRYFTGKNRLRQSQPSAAKADFVDGRKLPANLYELTKLQLRDGDLAAASQSYADLAAIGSEMLQINLLGYHLALASQDDRKAFQFADRVRYSPRKLQNPFDEEAKRLFKASQQLGANRYRAQCHEFMGSERWEEAQQLLDSLAERDRSATYLELLAELALEQEHFTDSLDALKELQDLSGPIPRIAVLTGDVLAAAGRLAEARESWLKAAELQVGVDLAALHFKLADSFKVVPDQESAVNFHLSLGHYYTGYDLLHRGHAQEAMKQFESSVESDSERTQAWFYLGESRRLSRLAAEARVAYKTCLKQNPHHGRALVSLSRVPAAND